MIQILKTKNNQIEKKKGESEMNYQQFRGTPSEMAKVLAKSENRREFLQYQNVDYWIHEYISGSGCSTYAGHNAMLYILYVLIFVLAELKLLPAETMQAYLADVNLVLDDVIKAAYEEKDWYLSKDMGLALCSEIVNDYTYHTIRKESESYIEDESKEELAIIFSNFLGCEPEKKFIEKLCSPGFDICVYPNSDKPVLNQIISNYSDMTYKNLYEIVHVDSVRYE